MNTFKLALSWVFIVLLSLVLPHFTTFVHEMGHFLFDKFSGMHVNLVSIGKGEVFYVFTLLDTPIEIHKNWGGGFVDGYAYRTAWRNFVSGSMGIVFGLSALLLITFVIQKSAGYGLSFWSFVCKIHVKAFRFILYMLLPILLVADYTQKLENEQTYKDYFKFFFYLYENGKNRYFMPIVFVAAGLVSEISNIIPGFYGEGGDGVPNMQALLQMFGSYYSLQEIASMGAVALGLFPYYLAASFALTFAYLLHKYSDV